jgi:AcrR family transcriptional regulator
MARRKDHSPEALKLLIRSAAEKIIKNKGLSALTARSLAEEIGYTPGTIYNFYKDMDALITDINFVSLGHLSDLCRARMDSAKAGVSRVKAITYAYVDFVFENTHAWEMLFALTRRGTKKASMPKAYQERLYALFAMIEESLASALAVPPAEAKSASRLLWASVHGIMILTQNGRLSLVGVADPRAMVDDFLKMFLSAYQKR